jgi:hypothetical protein
VSDRPFSPWDFVRRVLVGGAAIQQDYAAGKYAGYEAYSARLDAVAREMAAEMAERHPPTQGDGQ